MKAGRPAALAEGLHASAGEPLEAVEAIYRWPVQGGASPKHRTSPDLLRGLTISWAEHLWCVEFIHVPVTRAYFYVVAAMGWPTRHMFAWRSRDCHGHGGAEES